MIGVRLREKIRRNRVKLFLGFGLGSLFAMSLVLFYVCVMAFLAGGYVVLSVVDYGESVFELVLMGVGLVCGLVCIVWVVKWFR